MPRKNPAPMKLVCATNSVRAITIYDSRGRVLLDVELVVAEDGPCATTYFEYSPTGKTTSAAARKSGRKKIPMAHFSYDGAALTTQPKYYDACGNLVMSCSPIGMPRKHRASRFGRTLTAVDGGGRMTIRHYLAAPRKARKAKRSQKKGARNRKRTSRK